MGVIECTFYEGYGFMDVGLSNDVVLSNAEP